MLKEQKYHSPAARQEAGHRFDSRVVDIFFDKMVPEEFDFMEIRERAIPLPLTGPDGHRRVLLLGTTGAGKTTLVRQIIGTDPVRERFPSTSTAKTTTHDTEIILQDGGWRAVVTFVSVEEVRQHLNECISSAVLAAARGADEATVLRRLLNHVNQRYRFSYILGNGPQSRDVDFDLEDDSGEEDSADFFELADGGVVDLTSTETLLGATVVQLRALAGELARSLRGDLGVSGGEDERVLEEIFEEQLDELLRDDERFHAIADALMDEIERRFDLLPEGAVTRTKQGWPLSWTREWGVEDRPQFIRHISRFSSNSAHAFGYLLTPLVNGIRVAGPFLPEWGGGHRPDLVLFDGEGLGHTPKSSASVSTAVSRRIDTVDAVLLVDNATQPMQAAPLAAMREIVTSGNARKLLLAFTHFDEVKGDNLGSSSAKAQHVIASAENVLAMFGEDLGPYAERALRARLESARFFLGDLHEPLNESVAAGRRTIDQLRKLLKVLDKVVERPTPVHATPIYDRMNLVLAIRSATAAFHDGWRPRLGLEFRPETAKEHWTRVKALSRRLGTGWCDEYDSLKPVADLRKELLERIYVFLQTPVRWEGGEPDEDQRQAVFDALADSLGKRLLALSTRRVWHDRGREWEEAYALYGRGSTFDRARIIGYDIYAPAAPVPDMTPSPDRNEFLREVVTQVEEAAADVGARLE